MKRLSIILSVLWFAGWFLAGWVIEGTDGLLSVMTLIFPSFCLGYILCWETEKN